MIGERAVSCVGQRDERDVSLRVGGPRAAFFEILGVLRLLLAPQNAVACHRCRVLPEITACLLILLSAIVIDRT